MNSDLILPREEEETAGPPAPESEPVNIIENLNMKYQSIIDHYKF